MVIDHQQFFRKDMFMHVLVTVVNAGACDKTCVRVFWTCAHACVHGSLRFFVVVHYYFMNLSLKFQKRSELRLRIYLQNKK